MPIKAGKDYIWVGCWAIILNDKNEILLLKRAMTARNEPGMWSRPGGEVDFGESIKNAVEREILEELWIKVEATRQLDVTETIAEDGSTHRISFGYLAKHISGEPTNIEPDKHDDIRRFSLDDLPTNIAHYSKESIENYIKSI